MVLRPRCGPPPTSVCRAPSKAACACRAPPTATRAAPRALPSPTRPTGREPEDFADHAVGTIAKLLKLTVEDDVGNLVDYVGEHNAGKLLTAFQVFLQHAGVVESMSDFTGLNALHGETDDLIADDDLSVEEYIRQRRDFHVMPFAVA